jgi:hypothetical protein
MTLRAYGDTRGASICEMHAEQLEQAARAADSDALTLTQAAVECGYSADHLGRLVRAGKLPNLGRKNAPLVRRSALPRKPHSLPECAAARIVDAQGVRAIIDSMKKEAD